MQTKDITYFKTFGKALSKYLKDNGIKQAYLVKKTNKSKADISNYVNDRHEPVEETKQMLCEVLGIYITEKYPNKWIIQEQSSLSEGAPEVARADEVVIPKGGKLSHEELKALVEQIELMTKLLKDNL